MGGDHVQFQSYFQHPYRQLGDKASSARQGPSACQRHAFVSVACPSALREDVKPQRDEVGRTETAGSRTLLPRTSANVVFSECVHFQSLMDLSPETQKSDIGQCVLDNHVPDRSF